MASMTWIKIVTSIFDDEKIKLIDSLPDRDAILVIWFKILCQAGKSGCGGALVVANRIPLTDEMLSTVFNRPLNTVRLALKTFQEFGMIEITEERIISVPKWEKYQQVDYLEIKREQDRIRQRRHRDQLKFIEKDDLSRDNHMTVTCDKSQDSHVTVTPCHAPDIDIEKEKEEEKETPPLTPPQEGGEGADKGDGSQSRQKESRPGRDTNHPNEILPIPSWLNPKDWNDFLAFRKSIRAPMNPVAQTRAIAELERLRTEGNDPSDVISQSIVNGWKGLFPVKRANGCRDRDRPGPKTFEQIRAERTHAAAKRVLDEMYGPKNTEESGGTITI